MIPLYSLAIVKKQKYSLILCELVISTLNKGGYFLCHYPRASKRNNIQLQR